MKKRQRKRLHIFINRSDLEGGLLSMTPVEMLVGPTENWRGVTEISRGEGKYGQPTEVILYRVKVDSQVCWVVGFAAAGITVNAEQYDTRTAALKVFTAAGKN